MEIKNISPVFSEQDIQKRVKEIAKTLTEKFENQEPVVVGLLNTTSCFYTDLVRNIETDVICEFLEIKKFKELSPQGEVQISLDLTCPVENKDVIFIYDILNKGFIFNYLKNFFLNKKPKSLTTICLLKKTHSLKTKCDVDHVAFEASSDYVVGYGLSYNNKYHHLPYIGEILELN